MVTCPKNPTISFKILISVPKMSKERPLMPPNVLEWPVILKALASPSSCFALKYHVIGFIV